MMLALVDNSRRAVAERGLVGRCPHCLAEVIPRCGDIVCWHWAHKSVQDCDSWAEMGAWHTGWQSRFPIELCELPIGGHRADVLLPDGRVVEFQHSPLSVFDIAARERTYGSMLWVFDAVDPRQDNRLLLYPGRPRPGKPNSPRYRSFRWKHPRRSIAACTKPVYLDLGDGWLLNVRAIGDRAPCRGWGFLMSYDEFMAAALPTATTGVGL